MLYSILQKNFFAKFHEKFKILEFDLLQDTWTDLHRTFEVYTGYWMGYFYTFGWNPKDGSWLFCYETDFGIKFYYHRLKMISSWLGHLTICETKITFKVLSIYNFTFMKLTYDFIRNPFPIRRSHYFWISLTVYWHGKKL